jgi:hypothetical protein
MSFYELVEVTPVSIEQHRFDKGYSLPITCRHGDCAANNSFSKPHRCSRCLQSEGVIFR